MAATSTTIALGAGVGAAAVAVRADLAFGTSLVTGILVSIIFAIGGMLFKQCCRFSGEPPLFSGYLPFMGLAVEFGNDHAALLRKCAAQTSSTDRAFTLYIAGQRMTFLKSPADFSAVLREGRSRLQFAPVAEKIMMGGFGLSPNALKGKAYHDWNATSPSQWAMLRGKSLLQLMAKTQSELTKAVQEAQVSKEEGSGDDLYDFVSRLMWQATGRSFFGDLLGEEAKKMEEARQWFHTFDDSFPLLAGGVPPNFLRGVSTAMSKMRAIFNSPASVPSGLSEIVAFRQDFLSKNYDENSHGVFQLAFLWATMANTLPSTFWALYFILSDPAARAACTNEAEEIMGPWLRSQAQGDSQETDPDQVAKIINAMPCLESAVSEALRLCIGSLTLRRAMSSFDLNLSDGEKVRVREGDRVVLAPTLTHYDEEVYPQPFEFKWDRFMVSGGNHENRGEKISLSSAPSMPPRFKNGKKLPAAIALQPFGGGHTMCPGRHFARAEIKAFLALVLVSLDITILSNDSGETKVDDVPISVKGPGFPGFAQARAGLGALPPFQKVPFKIKLKQ